MSPTPLALFNGSYLGYRPTGIGVVSRDLSQALNPKLVRLLDPFCGASAPGSIPIPSNLMPDLGRKAHFRRLVWTQFYLPKIFSESGARFLLSPLPEAPIFNGVDTIVLAHDLLPLRYPQFNPLLAYHLTYVPLVLHSAVRVLCNSEATAKEVNSRLGIPLRKLVTIPLGFKKDNLFPLNKEREPFFLVLGRHDPHKNIPRVLEAFSFLVDKEIQVYFVGPHDSRYTPKLKLIAERLGISKRCKWKSWVSDQERLELLNTCQALVLASLWEGFGLPALEAMACHTPVIASNTGALPEVVSDAGLLINPKDSHEIADAMSQIISCSLTRKKLVEKAKLRLDIYTWENSARIIEEVILDLHR